MIDNRDPLAVKIGLGGKNYLIPKYGFTIVTADRVGTNYLTCNGGERLRLMFSRNLRTLI